MTTVGRTRLLWGWRRVPRVGRSTCWTRALLRWEERERERGQRMEIKISRLGVIRPSSATLDLRAARVGSKAMRGHEMVRVFYKEKLDQGKAFLQRSFVLSTQAINPGGKIVIKTRIGVEWFCQRVSVPLGI